MGIIAEPIDAHIYRLYLLWTLLSFCYSSRTFSTGKGGEHGLA